MKTNNTKRGGHRAGSGSKPHPPEQVASVRIVANVTPAEAQEWARRGRTAWLRPELRNESGSAEDEASFFKLLLLAVLEKTGQVMVEKDFEILPDHSREVWIRYYDGDDCSVECRKLAVPDSQ